MSELRRLRSLSRRPEADARIAKSRSALRKAIIELMGERPFGQLSAAEIARRASVGYATFFRHYSSKEALLAETVEGLVAEVADAMVPSVARLDTRSAARELARFVARRRTICRVLLSGPGEIVRKAIFERATAPSRAAPRWSEGIPGELSSVHAIGGAFNILGWWLERGGGVGVEEIADLLDQLVLAPLLNAPRGAPRGMGVSAQVSTDDEGMKAVQCDPAK